ncbi:CRISPR-associated endonuclease/helicase Cas3 [Paenibacillus sp. cl6col]|uniref:CRISPR-associated helicase/endonuclease Cas3 n=1 Tax=Paenibacillus sp. cl6col TaxID=1761878 RepID=UPI00087F99D7|nr:CRISPR-associated helicase/endonuclease Cas3 [Paenibacillus sp. cl6col]SDE62414.1 CRISPR-associated endonuclease/helicase Cas3 [Paenibacillus sp. cl6col]
MPTDMHIAKWLTDEARGKLHAHRPNDESSRAAETLEEHSDLVMQYAELLMTNNGAGEAVERAIKLLKIDGEELSESVRNIVRRYFEQAIYLHDLGKVNPAFQWKKMKNGVVGQRGKLGNSHHSLLSSVLYLHIYLSELRIMEQSGELSSGKRRNKKIFAFLRHVLYVFAYAISRHHTYLGDLEEPAGDQLTVFEKDIQRMHELVRENPDYVFYYRQKDSLLQDEALFQDIMAARNERFTDMHPPFPMYNLIKLLYSILVSSDFRAAYHYAEQKTVELQYFGKAVPLQPVIDAYQWGEIYKGIMRYQQNPETSELSEMNRLRAMLFLETDKRLLNNINEHIFYLEAPTGSGKTNMSINLALQLLNSNVGLNKLIYVFPFNSLIEQTKKTLDDVFAPIASNQYKIEVINSITPMVTVSEQEAVEGKDENKRKPDFDYKSILLQRQLLQYPVTLTSHVNLFSYLFGTGRESNLAFAYLCNSVIVLDEIQSYRNVLWKEIIHFLRSFAEILNMKIIIMSATLPQLDYLLERTAEDKCAETYSLVHSSEKYFTHPLFRDRVQLHFEYLAEGRIDMEFLLDHVVEIFQERKQRGKSNRILIEFISKNSARIFYDMIRQHVGMSVYELTGDDSHYYRNELLKLLGKDENGNFLTQEVIVIATQVIEAGVDIDMDIGFKDISMLDSEEQFLGRINRSCNRADCHAFFFDMDKANMIYRSDWRTEYDLYHANYQQMLRHKNFQEFYQLNMRRILESRQRADQNNWNYFINDVQCLNFPAIQRHMELIPDKNVSLFLNYNLDSEEGELCGESVWRDYVRLVSDRQMDYSERMVRLSIVRQQMNYFTYTYRVVNGETPRIYTERIGSLYYVPNGEEYMDWNEQTRAMKFNRFAYEQNERGPLL